jgi:hypothetical protein
VPLLPRGVRRRPGGWSAGGILTYATADLLDEVAYLAAVLHWPLDTLLDLEHPDRAHFLAYAHRIVDEAEAEEEEP